MSIQGTDIVVTQEGTYNVLFPTSDISTYVGVMITNAGSSFAIFQAGTISFPIAPQTQSMIPIGGAIISAKIVVSYANGGSTFSFVWFTKGEPFNSVASVSSINTGNVSVTPLPLPTLLENTWASKTTSTEGVLQVEDSSIYPKFTYPYSQGNGYSVNTTIFDGVAIQLLSSVSPSVPLGDGAEGTFTAPNYFSFSLNLFSNNIALVNSSTTVLIELILNNITTTPITIYTKTLTYSDFVVTFYNSEYSTTIPLQDFFPNPSLILIQTMYSAVFEITFSNLANNEVFSYGYLNDYYTWMPSDPNTATIATDIAAINTTLQTTNNDLAAIETSTSSTANSLMNITSGSTLNTQSNKISFEVNVNNPNYSGVSNINFSTSVPTPGFPAGEEFASFSFGGYIIIPGLNQSPGTVQITITGNTTGYQYVNETNNRAFSPYEIPNQVYPLYYNETISINISLNGVFSLGAISGYVGGIFMDELATDPSVSNILNTNLVPLNTNILSLEKYANALYTNIFVSGSNLVLSANSYSNLINVASKGVVNTATLLISGTIGTVITLSIDGSSPFHQEIMTTTPYAINVHNINLSVRQYASGSPQLYVSASASATILYWGVGYGFWE